MKFTAPARRLVRAIKAAGSLAPGTGKRYQIESTLLTVTETGHLEIQATDLNDSFWFSVAPEEGNSFVPGKIFVPSINLVNSIGEADKDEVTIELVKNAAQITWAKTKVKLPTEEVGDAPEIQRAKPDAHYVELPGQTLLGLLQRVNFAVSDDFKNRAMSFVRMQVKQKTLKLSATDGVRIASVEVDVTKSQEDYAGVAYVLPIKPARVKLLVDGENEKPVKLRVSDHLVSFSTDSSEMTVRPGAAVWADFEIEKELEHPKKVFLPVKDLKQLLDNAELLKARGETTCEFKWTQDGLEMESLAGVEGSVRSKIPAEWPHDPMSIKLDPSLFVAAVNACSSEQVELSFASDQEPMVMREMTDQMLYLYALGARY